MVNLKEELELKIESLNVALKEIINLDEINNYIKLHKILLSIKMNKNNLTIASYNDLFDEIINKIDVLKENPNVKLFLDLLENLRKSKEALEMIQFADIIRK